MHVNSDTKCQMMCCGQKVFCMMPHAAMALVCTFQAFSPHYVRLQPFCIILEINIAVLIIMGHGL